MLAGLNIEVLNDADPIDYVRSFISDELFDLIVEQSNSYIGQCITKEKCNFGKYARASDWKLVTREEMIHFFALVLVMGIDKKPTILNY